MLKPQDVIIVLKIVAMHQREWKYSSVALELHMSPSEVHAGVKRLKRCSLLSELEMGVGTTVQKMHLPEIANFKEFLRYGIRYIFPAVLTEPVNGLPTANGVEHLFEGFTNTGYTPVWAYELGDYTGVGVNPLYRTAPYAAVDDFRLYELLALTDAARMDDKLLRDFAFAKLNLMLGEM